MSNTYVREKHEVGENSAGIRRRTERTQNDRTPTVGLVDDRELRADQVDGHER